MNLRLFLNLLAMATLFNVSVMAAPSELIAVRNSAGAEGAVVGEISREENRIAIKNVKVKMRGSGSEFRISTSSEPPYMDELCRPYGNEFSQSNFTTTEKQFYERTVLIDEQLGVHQTQESQVIDSVFCIKPYQP